SSVLVVMVASIFFVWFLMSSRRWRLPAVHHVCQPAILRKPASLRAATVAPCAGVGCARPTIGCRRPDLEIRDPCSAADDVGESGGRTVERHGTDITRP